MADVFISYAKAEAELTIALARNLEVSGLSVWWDTSLLPDDTHFPETIRQEISNARAAVVIWTPSSVKSRWVYAEAKMADEQQKLIQLRTAELDLGSIPLPFNAGQIGLVTDQNALFRALRRKGVKARADASFAAAAVREGLEGTTWHVTSDDGSSRRWRFEDGGKVVEVRKLLIGLVKGRISPLPHTWKQNGNDVEVASFDEWYKGKISHNTMAGTYHKIFRASKKAAGSWTASYLSSSQRKRRPRG
jgi:hypothetical protein